MDQLTSQPIKSLSKISDILDFVLYLEQKKEWVTNGDGDLKDKLDYYESIYKTCKQEWFVWFTEDESTRSISSLLIQMANTELKWVKNVHQQLKKDSNLKLTPYKAIADTGNS